MDAGPFFVVGAWAPVPSRVVVTKDRTQQLRPSTTTTTTTVGKAVDTLPQQIPTKAAAVGHLRTACMRGPGREFPPTDPAKGAIECPRPEAKVESCSDDTPVDFGPRSGLASRTSAGRRAQGSASSSSPPRGGGAAVSELPTVAEVLRTAKTFLQPTHAVERQFYADCYRACQVMHTTTTTTSTTTATTTTTTSGRPSGPAEGGGSNPALAPPALPYLSSVPEVALRLSCLGHRVVLRRVTDSRQYWSRSMTNLFCYCVLPGTGIGYVLDPGFKEHFRAGRMSDRYRDIWECLPPLFVGPPAKLVQLVQSLCSELQASFESGHRQLPPWRTFSCTINRWMSPVFRDLPVPLRRPVPPTAAAAAATGGGGGGTTGMIPAADAQAFLRACEELLAGTASAWPGGYRGVVAATAAAAAAAAAASTATVLPAAAGGGASAAAAAQVQGANAGPGLSTGAEDGQGRGVRGGAEAGTSSAGRGCAAEAAPASGDAARPMAYGGGVAATTAAAGRVEVPGGAIAASTAATAAASSSAWGPPPRSAVRQPLRIVTGFELRQVAARVRVRLQAPGGGDDAAAPLAAAGGASAGSSAGPTPLMEPIRSAATPLARRMASMGLVGHGGEQLRQTGLQQGWQAAEPAGATAATEAAAEAFGSPEGLLSRSFRSLSLVPLPPRRQQQQQQAVPSQRQQ